MTKQEVINNITANYSVYGVSGEWIEEQIRGGEREGFSYQTIYTGLRMALGSQFGREELFTVSEMAEALGATEDEIIQQIEEMKGELEAAGEDVSDYIKQRRPAQRFIIPPGKYLS